MHLAAGIAYYAFFSMFPLILGLIAILGLFLEPLQVQQRLLDMTLQVFPASADLVAKNIQGVVVSRGKIGIIKATWEDIWPGALLTAVLFEVGKNLFAWYLTSFANYALIYGALAAVVALLFWAYISAVVLLLGAEFTSEYSRLMGSGHEEPLNSA